MNRKPSALVKTDNGLRGMISMYEIIDERLVDDYLNIEDYMQVRGRWIMDERVAGSNGRGCSLLFTFLFLP
jgi:hypothetical protein